MYFFLIDMQLRFCSDQIQKLEDNKSQSSVGLENAQRRLSDIRTSSQQVRDTVVDVQSKITSSRVTCMELEVELDKERYLVCNVFKLFSSNVTSTQQLWGFFFSFSFYHQV
jgi:chromosome segregation ATPase